MSAQRCVPVEGRVDATDKSILRYCQDHVRRGNHIRNRHRPARQTRIMAAFYRRRVYI